MLLRRLERKARTESYFSCRIKQNRIKRYNLELQGDLLMAFGS